jgi:C-terminal processing protease CtpA/Prc
MEQPVITQIWAWKCIALIFVIWACQSSNAQESLPIVKANTKTVDIKDGAVLQKGIWNLTPKAKPDIYYALEAENEGKVTFYTDIDSISFNVTPGHTYDFIILLNNKDTCYTQISSLPKKQVGVAIIDPELLKKDFTFLREALLQEHGGLFRYRTRNEFTQLSDSLFHTLDHPMNQFEFGKLVRFFLSSVKDGHTGSSLPSELMQYYAGHVRMFPIQLYFRDERAFVLCNGLNELPAGTELLSIDGKPINNIIKVLFRYLSSDGNIGTKKLQTLNRDAFPFLYSWVFGEKSGYTITHKTQAGIVKNMDLKADYIKESCIPNGHNNGKYLQLDFKSGNISVLTIKTFSSERLRQTSEDFVRFLRVSFKEIKSQKVEKLIIDLRNNSGGDDQNGALLYSYLTNSRFRYFASIKSNTKKFSIKDHPGLGVQEPSLESFKGKVLFIINGLSFSTTSDFCAIAKSENRGIFVGEETGGGYYGNTSGETFRTTLPNSKINIAIPKYKYSNAVKKARYQDRGVIPDYVVIPSISDVIIGKDVQLEYALGLIEQ